MQCSVHFWDLHCQCNFSIFPTGEHQLKCKHTCVEKFRLILFINDEFALKNARLFSYIINILGLPIEDMFTAIAEIGETIP